MTRPEQTAEIDADVKIEFGVRYADGKIYCYGVDDAAERRAKYLAGRYAESVTVRREVRRGPWLTEGEVRASAPVRSGWSDRTKPISRPEGVSGG